MLYVGIDWAVDGHTVALLAEPGKVLRSFAIKNSLEGFLELLAAIRRYVGPGRAAPEPADVLFAIETRDVRLVDFLSAHDFTGYLIEPTRMKGYRLRYSSSGNKTDPDDAFILGDVLARDRDALTPMAPPDPAVLRLKLLLVDRERLVRDQTRLTNRLIACLRQYFPEALELFADVAGKTALEFLASWPDFAQARQLTRAQVQAFLAARRCHRPGQLDHIMKVLVQEPIPVPPVLVEMKGRYARHLIRELQTVAAAVADYDAELEHAGKDNGEINLMGSLPGAGPVIATGLHTLLGTDRSRFATANEVQSLVGTAPRLVQSGNSRAVCFRFGCNRFYRTLLQQMALTAMRARDGSVWARQYYERKRAEGKTHQHALRCLANLLLKVAFAVWRDRKPYCEERHLAQIARHQLRLKSCCA